MTLPPTHSGQSTRIIHRKDAERVGAGSTADRTQRAIDLSTVTNEQTVAMFIEERWESRAEDELERIAAL